MTLSDFLDRVDRLVPLERGGAWSTAAGASVTSVEYDSRRAAAGSVFFALKGQQADGNAFATDAIGRGAVAVVSDSPAPQECTTPWVKAADARRALAAAAAILYRHPSEELLLVGVTGTNGKTTTTYLLDAIFEQAGLKAGCIGTIGYRVGNVEHAAARTTPEAPEVQRLLREMVEAHAAACAMEVSSHALALARVDFTRFSAAVFTNLTRDHLDFHAGMEDYFLAKRRLFDLLPAHRPAVVNVDDPYGARLAREFPHAITYGIEHRAAVSAASPSLTVGGQSLQVNTPRGALALRSSLRGRPNAYNILAAVATAQALDIPLPAIERGIQSLVQVPGRFEVVSGEHDDVTVVVDYAHTDDALRTLLETARPLTRGRLVTVFGCGGDRDKTKRPLMGAVAARLSDVVVMTSDNPRSERPDDIIEEIKRGVVPPARVAVHGGQPVAAVRSAEWTAIVDRRAAIEHAIALARPGDLVLIAGKGHETYQEVGGRVLPFDDGRVAREALAARRRTVAATPDRQ